MDMAARPTCNTKRGKINYAKLNEARKEAAMSESEILEEGQIAESPFHINPEGDDFLTEPSGLPSTLPDPQFEDGDSTAIGDGFVPDCEDDDISDPLSEQEQVPEDNDLGRDEVWHVQAKAMQEAREQRERVKKRLVRQKMLAEEKLCDEHEHAKIAKMEQEIVQLNKERSVVHTKTIQNKAGRGNTKGVKAVTKSRSCTQIVREHGTQINKHHKHDNHDTAGNPNRGLSDRNQVTIDSHNQLKDVDKVTRWLASSDNSGLEDLIKILEADRDITPEHDNTYNFTHNLDSRRAMADQRKTTQGAAGEVVPAPPQEEKKNIRPPKLETQRGARPKVQMDEDDGESIKSCCTIRSCTKTDVLRVSRVTREKGDTNRQNLRSGFLDKPRSIVVQKLRWPHMNQNPRYVTEPLTFNQLSFAQFIGGEAHTILKTLHADEMVGRLKVMSKVAYLLEQCKSGEKARAVYFVILSSIEEGEATWMSSFAHFDLMCCPVINDRPTYEKSEAKMLNPFKQRTLPKHDLYCREFQKGDCQQQPPHRAWIKNGYDMVDHFCQYCYKAKLGKLMHLPGTEGCIQVK